MGQNVKSIYFLTISDIKGQPEQIVSNDINKRILIVDADVLMHQAYQEALTSFEANSLENRKKTLSDKSNVTEKEQVRYEIDSAFTGDQAVQMVKTALADGSPYAIVFIDVLIAHGLNGIAAIQLILGLDKDILAVICSAKLSRDVDEALEPVKQSDRLKSILPKPFDVVEIRQIAESLTAQWAERKTFYKQVDQFGKPVEEGKYFLMLCFKERWVYYQNLVDRFPVVVVESVEAIIIHALRTPPLAIFLDMQSQLKLGIAKVTPIYNLGMSWPVFRLIAQKEGECRAVSMDPPYSGSLEEAVDLLATQNADLVNARFPRKRLRVNVNLRVLIKREDTIFRSNGLDISPNGIFLCCYEPFELHTFCDLEIFDLGKHPIKLLGEVAWCRRWEDQVKVPGAGFEFKSPESERVQLLQWLISRERVKSILMP